MFISFHILYIVNNVNLMMMMMIIIIIIVMILFETLHLAEP
jgi:hypothetical protein